MSHDQIQIKHYSSGADSDALTITHEFYLSTAVGMNYFFVHMVD